VPRTAFGLSWTVIVPKSDFVLPLRLRRPCACRQTVYRVPCPS